MVGSWIDNQRYSPEIWTRYLTFRQVIIDIDTSVVDKQLQSHYIYIDNRPVSLIRNPAKQFLKLLREAYSSDHPLQHSFIYLNFICDVDKVRYDCNLDPAKSEIFFENFEQVCEAFQQLLDKVCVSTIHGSPILAHPNLSCSELNKALMVSTPPSSPIRNAYAGNGKELPRFHTSESRNAQAGRQMRLEEFQSDAISGTSQSKLTNSDTHLTETLRAVLGQPSSINGINLADGIVSSRQHVISQKDKHTFTQVPETDSDMIAGHHSVHSLLIPPVTEDDTFSRKKPKTSSKSRSERIRSDLMDIERPHISPLQTPLRPVKKRTASESPQGLNVLERTVNPWTIAAMTASNRPAAQPVANGHSRTQDYGETVLQFGSESEEMFMQLLCPDMNLQSRVVVCRIIWEDIYMDTEESLFESRN